MFTELKQAISETLKREENTLQMFVRFSKESKDKVLKDFFNSLATDIKQEIKTLKKLKPQEIIKSGLSLSFQNSPFHIDKKTIKKIKNKKEIKELIDLAIKHIDLEIEYFEHLSAHSLFPEVKRLFHTISNKELNHKHKLKRILHSL